MVRAICATFDGMRQARAIQIAFVIDENLRFVDRGVETPWNERCGRDPADIRCGNAARPPDTDDPSSGVSQEA